LSRASIVGAPGYVGPAIDDRELFDALPSALRALLGRRNGYVSADGWLHLRGACSDPAWHSLRAVWLAEDAYHRRYSALTPSDVPFAEFASGEQFLLRGHSVLRLDLQTGDLVDLQLRLGGFFRLAEQGPPGTRSSA
jgi:hypothetical protein